MPHKTIGTLRDNFTLCWDESDVSAEAQQGVNENHQGDYRDSIPHARRNQRYALPGKCGKPKSCVCRNEGQEPEPGIWSYTNGSRPQHHHHNDDEKLQAENGARKVHMTHRPAAIYLESKWQGGHDGDGLVDPRDHQQVHETTSGHGT